MGCLLVLGAVGRFLLYPQLDAAKHWRRAQAALDGDDFARSRTDLERCLEVWPNSAETEFLLARTCRRAEDFASAQAHLKRARQLGWVNELIDLEALLSRAQLGLVRPVEQTLRGYLSSGHRDAALILEALVRGCLRSNSLNEAYRWSTVWVEQAPAAWRAQFWAGRVLEAGLRYDLAAEAYQRALENKPDQAPIHLRLAAVLVEKGRYAEALPHFETVLDYDPESPDARVGLARCQRVLCSPEVARATLEPLFARHQESAAALLLRGQLALDAGTPEEALGWLRQAEARTPQDSAICQSLTTALRLSGKREEAQAYERKHAQLTKDLKRMAELVQETIAHPEEVSLRYEAGTLLLRLGQQEEGITWLAGVLLLDPNHQPTRKALAEVLPRLGTRQREAYRRQLLETGPASKKGAGAP